MKLQHDERNRKSGALHRLKGDRITFKSNENIGFRLGEKIPQLESISIILTISPFFSLFSNGIFIFKCDAAYDRNAIP